MICPNCGCECDENSMFCTKCGTKINAFENDIAPTPIEKAYEDTFTGITIEAGKEETGEIAKEELKKENKDLKEKNEFLMKRDNKLHSIIDEFLKQQIHDKDLYLSQRLIRNLKQENKELKKQQKEFIELLEKEIVDSKTGSSQQYYAKEHLSKYKEIIGSDKE